MKQTVASFYSQAKHRLIFFNKNKHAFRQSLCPNVFVFVFAFKLVPADILRAYSDSARVSMII